MALPPLEGLTPPGGLAEVTLLLSDLLLLGSNVVGARALGFGCVGGGRWALVSCSLTPSKVWCSQPGKGV